MATANRGAGATVAGSQSRAVAARLVDRVATEGATIDAALAALEAEMAGQRPRIQALAYGVLRSHYRLNAIIDRLLDRPVRPRDRILRSLLAVGLFELLESVQPAYAVVSAAVDASRLLDRPGAAGLINAALRRFQRESSTLLPAVDSEPATKYSHPHWLVQQLKADWPNDWQAVLAANQELPPLWLRVNRLRTTPAEAAATITAATGVAVARDTHFPDGLRLASPLPVDEIPGFADGELTVQDAASQLAAELLDIRPGLKVLDACAAPGGKATHLLERAGGDLDLTALDVDESRLQRVRENLARLALTARVLPGDASRPETWWDGQLYDRILVDAPCSGTGVIRRHPDIKLLRRAADLPELAARQGRILRSLWPLLRPGGRLIYATCSVLSAENAAVLTPFLTEQRDARSWCDTAGLRPAGLPPLARPAGPGWQILPGTADADGFHYAVLERLPG